MGQQTKTTHQIAHGQRIHSLAIGRRKAALKIYRPDVIRSTSWRWLAKAQYRSWQTPATWHQQARATQTHADSARGRQPGTRMCTTQHGLKFLRPPAGISSTQVLDPLHP